MGNDWAIGAPLFFPPIRFWENKEPETGSVAAHVDFHGEALRNPTADGFVYAFHDGFGHNVYMKRAACFISHSGAVAEIARLNAEKEKEDAAYLEIILERIASRFPHVARPALTKNEGLHHG